MSIHFYPHRAVRSYVLRQRNFTAVQRKAYHDYWPQFGVEFPLGKRLESADVVVFFGNTHPVILEIGFGHGESLCAQALAAPHHNFLGVEVHLPGIGSLLAGVVKTGIHNIRVINADAVSVIEESLPEACLSGVQIFFPDPWPKTRHHKRRLIQPAFLHKLRRVMQSGAVLHCATDCAHYAIHMLSVLNAAEGFRNTSSDGTYVPRPEDRPLTKYERRGHRLQHEVWDLVFVRE